MNVIPEFMSVKEKIIYTSLSDGMTNTIAIRNALQKIPKSTVYLAVKSLLKEGSLVESSYKYRDPAENRPRKLNVYRLTTKGIKRYLPPIANYSPVIRAWNSLYKNIKEAPDISHINAVGKERRLRVLEAEQFCSSAGILTKLDKRPVCSSSVNLDLSRNRNAEKPLTLQPQSG